MLRFVYLECEVKPLVIIFKQILALCSFGSNIFLPEKKNFESTMQDRTL